MGIVTNRGKQAKESANQSGSNIDFEKAFIRLKDGESVRVRIMTAEDYIEYKAHGSFKNKIWTQPCIGTDGKQCALCEANDASIEGFDDLYAKKRYLFAMADLDMGEVRFFDATKGQAKDLIDTIDEYEESLGELAFTFKRSGTKKETSYKLNPIIKLKKADQELFDKFNDETVADDSFEAVLMPRTRAKQILELKKAEFPVADVFGYVPSDDDNDGGESKKDESKPIQDNGDPTDIF